MRFLVVSSEPGWVDAVAGIFPAPDTVMAVDVPQLAQNPALLAAADACFVAEAATSPWTVDTVKQISALAETPVFVLAEAARSQWEEAVLFAGAQQIFRRPFRGTVMQLAISRCDRRRVGERTLSGGLPMTASSFALGGADPSRTLATWRDFSRVLADVSDPARVVGEYLAQLRNVLGCGRVILYVAETAGAERMFRCQFAAGTDPKGLEAFRLSQRAGVAHLIAERGTVVSRQRLRPDSGREVIALRELMVVGAEIALPIADKSGVVGLLFIGPRVSGTEYLESELTLIYQAVETIGPLLTGMARVPADVAHTPASMLLQAIPAASALVCRSSRTIEANAAFRTLLGRSDASALTYDDLPASWSAAITAAVQNRAASARVELEHRLIGAPRKLRLTVRRLTSGNEAGPDPSDNFLVHIEDATAPAGAAAEADAHSAHNLLQRAGEQLSNEFRNALTPVDIMVQLARDASTTRVELERLSGQVGTAMHRLRRRIDDLAYLTKSAIIPEPTTVAAVLRVTRERLDEWLEDRHLKRIIWLNEFCETALMADNRAVALALAELVINAVEASTGQQVTVTAEDGGELITFRVRNSGVWTPPPESSGFRHRPFVSTKSAGVGLGIEVASRVAENHGGRLLLGPISADTIEATMRLPRSIPEAAPAIETRVARAL